MRNVLVIPFVAATLQAQSPTPAFFRGDLLPVAQSCAERALAKDPKNVEIVILMGRIRSALGDRAGAEVQFLRAEKLRPKDVDTYLALGRARLEQGDRVKAEACFYQAQRLKPNAVDSYRQIAEAWMSVGAKESALAQMEKMKEWAPRDPNASSEFAVSLMGFGFVREASALMELSFASNAKNWAAFRNFGSACLRARQPELANLWFTRAIAVNPLDSNIHKEVALAYAGNAAMEDMAIVKPRMLAAAELGFPADDQDNESLVELAGIRLVAGQREEADALIQRLAKSEEIKVECYRSLGRTYLRAGMLPEAFQTYGAILQSRNSAGVIGEGPKGRQWNLRGFGMVKVGILKRKQALGDAAMDLSSKGFIDQALPLMKEVQLVDPGDNDWLLQFGVACLKAGRRDEAALYFSAAATLIPKDSDCWNTISAAYLDAAGRNLPPGAAPSNKS